MEILFSLLLISSALMLVGIIEAPEINDEGW